MQTEHNDSISFKSIVVRLLNGTLKGCEYHLSAGKTLFIAADEMELSHEPLPSFPEDSVLIPADGDGVNFEIVVPDSTGQGVLLRELRDNAARERMLESQRPYRVGDLVLAIRCEDENWSEEILEYQADAAVNPPPVRKTWRKKGIIAAIVCTAVIASVLAIFQTNRDIRQREIVALAGRLTNEPEKFRILSGRDGQIYVLANDDRDAAWGRQSLVRLKPDQQVNIASYQEEIQRIERWIGNNYPFLKLHQFKLDQPTLPSLLMSRQRTQLTGQQKQGLREDLLKVVPYASDIQFDDIDDRAVAEDAEAGIKKLAVPYTRQDNADSVTFIITGSLNDGERQRVRHFIENYDNRWNGGYVEFALELQDDWLKGKSFKYGQHGYVKVSPGHWYFPKP